MTNQDFNKLECRFMDLYPALSKLNEDMYWARDARSYSNLEVERKALVKVNNDLKAMTKILLEARAIIKLDPLYSNKAPVAVTSEKKN